MTRGTIIYLASFAAHGALAAGVVSLKGTRVRETVAISVVETKAKPKPPEAPPPPAPKDEPKPEAAKPKAKAAPKPEAAPTPVAASDAPTGAGDAPSVPDFGLALSGGGGGLAVPAATSSAPSPGTSATTTRKVLAAPTKTDDACTEALKKPKATSITQPAYTAAAREAGIAGKVRIELTVDATGRVASARVLEGLGHGLDEAALAAARAATFEPGTRCGKPTTATFVIAIRFSL